MVERYVGVETRAQVLHCYHGAGKDAGAAVAPAYTSPQLKIVQIRLWLGVSHVNRDVEYYALLAWLDGCFQRQQPNDFGDKSLEAIADDLHSKVTAQYPGRGAVIEIVADGVTMVRSEYPAKAAA